MPKWYWEKAKSNRSSCGECGKKIMKSSIRLIIMDSYFGIPSKNPYHRGCGKKIIIREIKGLRRLLNDVRSG